MESLGNYLRHLRLARGRSPEEVARTTRVASRYLEALEEDRWSELPAPVFIKGFIRAYCQALGVSPGEALARYTAALEALDSPALVTPRAPATRGLTQGPVLVSLILLIALGFGLFLVSLGVGERSAPEVTARMAPVAGASFQPVPAPPPPAPTAVTQGEQATRLVLWPGLPSPHGSGSRWIAAA